MAMTKRDDTLMIVTADHSHTFAISGYSDRGNPILGLAAVGGKALRAKDGKAYTTLGYANGPGATADEPRTDPAPAEAVALAYRQKARVPLGSATRGGDVVVPRA